MIAGLRALLALALLAGVYLLTAAVVLLWAGFAVAAVWATGDRHGGPQFNTTPLLVVAATAVPVALAVRELARASRPAGARPDSRLLPRNQAPELWRLVEELARQVGTAPPTEIRLVDEANASVTDDFWLFAVTPARRRLYLGVPLLVGLAPDELRAVLAHELGHYAGRHAWFTEPAHRSHAALVMARERIRGAMVANRLIQLYAGLLLLTFAVSAALAYRLVRPVRQRQELEADRIAARVAGAAALADGLRSVPAIGATWARFQQEIVEPVRRGTGRVPDDPYRAFAALLDDPAYRPELSALRIAAESLPADGFHPGVRRRLDLLATLTSGAPPPPAPDLATSWRGGTTRRVVSRPGRRQPWPQWLATAAAYRADREVAELARALRPEGGPLTVEDVLTRLEAGRVDLLAARLDPDPYAGHARLVETVTATLGAALVRQGHGHWTTGWFGPSRLTGAPVDHDDLAVWAAGAVDDPAEASRLRTRLVVHDVDPAGLVTDPPPVAAAPRTLTIPAEVDEATGQTHRNIAWASLTVLIGLVTMAFLYWLNDEPASPPYRLPPAATPGWTEPPGQFGRYPVTPAVPVPPAWPPLASRPPLPTFPLLPTGPPEGVRVLPIR
ncbi:M48 family metallopeptidase [Micromonospora sp. WMMD882]|uniref:M48 family metallopeptidase n=1 Tax=Micromonospora sp. WMMD882 TaxID=3015151 RepID=UPI00248BE66B|nr:M48 family metallopeptidase [Micromonospora sp. WMMD882]WBB80662.1 M48 family metallopeptidase [Micromonospora sp. WMMD882]